MCGEEALPVLCLAVETVLVTTILFLGMSLVWLFGDLGMLWVEEEDSPGRCRICPADMWAGRGFESNHVSVLLLVLFWSICTGGGWWFREDGPEDILDCFGVN